MADLRPIFIDIDGTLTEHPSRQWARIIPKRIEHVRKLLDDGRSIVIWSGGGGKYAREWAERFGLGTAICIGKPELIVDDNPHIRPVERMPILSPEEFFK